LYTVTQILNNTRRGRSNQWRSSCRMLVNPRSNFRVLVITHAATLRTHWSLSVQIDIGEQTVAIVDPTGHERVY